MVARRMRISLSGTHATGKTSLLRACESALAGHPEVRAEFIGETARKVLAMGLPLNQDATLESYFQYLCLQLEAERTATAPVVISDRSLVDSLAYLEVSRMPEIPESYVALQREIVQMEMGFFDVFCYVPIEFGLHADRVRPADTEYQEAVEEQLARILGRYGARVVTVHGPTEQRVGQVLELLGLKAERG